MMKFEPKMSKVEAVSKFAGAIQVKNPRSDRFNLRTVQSLLAVFGCKAEVYHDTLADLQVYIHTIPACYEEVRNDEEDFIHLQVPRIFWEGHGDATVGLIYDSFMNQFNEWEKRLQAEASAS